MDGEVKMLRVYTCVIPYHNDGKQYCIHLVYERLWDRILVEARILHVGDFIELFLWS